ncbi:MAG: 50S ribosomal protein L11 methyltransferase [Rickettsiales bacterium]
MKNPFAQPLKPRQMMIEAPPEILGIIELRAEEVALAITRMIDAVVPHLVLIVDAAGEAAMREIVTQVDAGARVRVVALEPIDWVEKVQKDFPPFRLGRFFVHGSHARHEVPRNTVPLLIDAVAAFGTGEHATTAGCLEALAMLRKKMPRVRRVLDMGCGTAILAIAAAKLWPRAWVDACDNDVMAARVSAHNLRANRVNKRSRAWVSDGYRPARVRDAGPHEMVVANILARPLMKMARAASAQMGPDGVLILSGLLRSQERMVLAAHRAQGRYLMQRLRRGNWSVLVLR